MTNILVVEDERLLDLDIKSRLESMGYQVPVVVHNGELAIKTAIDTFPDLILMGIVLEGDSDGVEASKKIKEVLDIPIIYLTAYSDPGTLERAKTTDPSGYLIKPFENAELRATIEIALHQHERESKLRYMSMHDALTGLHNWNYFEEEKSRLKDSRTPVCVILCDVDGLKTINDGFGHGNGDKILQKTAEILRGSVRQEDLVARIGGDEFGIILHNCSESILNRVYQRILTALDIYNNSSPEIPLSISFGLGIKYPDDDLNDALKKADDSMYHEKLTRTQSSQSHLINMLDHMLEERDIITAEHLQRVDKLVQKFALKLNLKGELMSRLRLLAKFHDLGKIAIPDAILKKKGPLTPEEMGVMKRHVEVGYRIAKSSPDIYLIADLILKHHEWWNGKGYPLGLKGKQIPLEARIIAIVDAYDAMVSERPYRKPLENEDAMKELEKSAGEQFDPELVKKFVKIMSE